MKKLLFILVLQILLVSTAQVKAEFKISKSNIIMSLAVIGLTYKTFNDKLSGKYENVPDFNYADEKLFFQKRFFSLIGSEFSWFRL